MFVLVGLVGLKTTFALNNNIAVALDQNEDIIVDVLTSIVIKSPEAKSYLRGDINLVADISGVQPGVTDTAVMENLSLVWQASLSSETPVKLIIGKVKCSVGSKECTISWNTKSVKDGAYTIGITTSDNLNKSEPVDITVDNTAPEITVAPYITTQTDQNITVTATTNEGTLNFNSHTFTENGSFNFIATDLAGNITTKTVTITNIDKTVPSTLLGINIVHPANKLSYKIGEALDITGLVVAGNYKNGTSKIEDITLEDITGFDSSIAKNGQILIITFGGKTATYAIDIKAESVSGGGGSSSGGGGSYIRRPAFVFSATPPVGQVLGASTENNGVCSSKFYLNKYIKSGSRDNDVTEVVKLQLFLNEYLGTKLLTDGNYGPDTVVAVNAFQIKNRQQVLVPWIPYGLEDSSRGTGYVFKTTKRWINLIKCPELNIPMPNLN